MKNENKSINYVQITYVEITKKKKDFAKQMLHGQYSLYAQALVLT